MNVSDRKVVLNSFFPFSSFDENFNRKALELGKCVNYTAGESLLTSGSPARYCGLILEGQAVAFKKDSEGKRYQVCLEAGCFIGLETLDGNQCFTSKVTAVTDLEVFFWNSDGLRQLSEESIEFERALNLLNEGRSYQERWLIPDTEMTDPVLASRNVHWLSIISPLFVILPLLFLLLWVCALMIRRYPVVWLLVFALLAAAGSLLYRQIISRLNERVILTTRNYIHIPRHAETNMTVARLYQIQSITIEQNFLKKMINAGQIVLNMENSVIKTPLLSSPNRTAELIHSFAVRAALGRNIPLISHDRKFQREKRQGIPESEQRNDPFVQTNEPFQTIEFRAHWALLLKKIIKPLLLLILSIAAAGYLRKIPNTESIRRIMLFTALIAISMIIYQFLSWRSHRFTIEKDCVRDFSRRPLSHEDQNLAMNYKIQSVRYAKKGFFQNMLDYGTVYILAGEGELSFDYVRNPKYVQQQIMETCSLYESRRTMNRDPLI